MTVSNFRTEYYGDKLMMVSNFRTESYDGKQLQY